MPAASLKAMAQQSGIPLKRAEHLWDKAKKLATKQGVKKKDGEDDYYAYVTGIVKKMMSLGKRTATASDQELEAAGLGVIVADLEQLKKMEAPVKFTHAESGSTITLASDGSLVLHAKGDVKINMKKPPLVAATDGDKVYHALKARMHTDKLVARMKAKPATAADEGDESKKWEGIALAIIKALGTSSLTAQQIANAIGRDLADTEAVLDEMLALNGAAKLPDNKWSLTAEGAALAKQPAE